MPKPSPTPPPAQATKHRPTKLYIGLAVISLIIILGTIYLWTMDQRPSKTTAATAQPATTQPQAYTYSFDDVTADTQATLKPLLDAASDPKLTEPTNENTKGDLIITAHPTATNPTIKLPGNLLTHPITETTILTQTQLSLGLKNSGTITTQQMSSLQASLTQSLAASQSTWTYLALGDIIPARDVYTYSKKRGYGYPFLAVQDRTKTADLTVANLETTVADGQAFLEGKGVLNFTAPAASLTGLSSAGIDGVNLANNHSMNGGAAKVSTMLTNLQAQPISSFGVGPGSSPATWTTTVHGQRITHLGYDTVPGSIEPTATTPGAHRIPLQPWGTLSDADIASVQANIRTAKQSSDIVIPWFHWGTEYTHDANAQQRQLAQACIDAGAEAVIGTHPHWTQGLELYKGHLIAYSLGNFVFDQNWSEETKRSVALELTFNGPHVIGAQLLPAKIDNWIQPHFLAQTDPLYSQILSDIAAHSWWQ